MNIKQQFLSINEYSRPGWKRHETLGLIYHWTAVAMQLATVVANYYEQRKYGKTGYGSATYVVDVDGSILQLMPEEEVALHVGEQSSRNIDPASGRVYTDWARDRFGIYGDVDKGWGPNWVTIGIEMVPIDNEGRFTSQTLGSGRELGVDICRRHNLSVEGIGTHHDVVGWKDCPRWWVNHPEDFEYFKQLLARQLHGGTV